MHTISYQYEVPFVDDGHGVFPGFWLTLSPLEPGLTVQALAALDSGTEFSLFDGTLAQMLDLDLMAGEKQTFVSATGSGVTAYKHLVCLQLSDIGEVVLPVAFSSGPLRRNLLGRDFFFAFNVGFHERARVVYLAPEVDTEA